MPRLGPGSACALAALAALVKPDDWRLGQRATGLAAGRALVDSDATQLVTPTRPAWAWPGSGPGPAQRSGHHWATTGLCADQVRVERVGPLGHSALGGTGCQVKCLTLRPPTVEAARRIPLKGLAGNALSSSHFDARSARIKPNSRWPSERTGPTGLGGGGAERGPTTPNAKYP